MIPAKCFGKKAIDRHRFWCRRQDKIFGVDYLMKSIRLGILFINSEESITEENCRIPLSKRLNFKRMQHSIFELNCKCEREKRLFFCLIYETEWFIYNVLNWLDWKYFKLASLHSYVFGRCVYVWPPAHTLIDRFDEIIWRSIHSRNFLVARYSDSLQFILIKF